MTNSTMTDLQLKAQKAILDDPRTREQGIEILDDNGVLMLEGHVTSREVKETAESILREVLGVISVINRLEIQVEEPEGTFKEKAKSV